MNMYTHIIRNVVDESFPLYKKICDDIAKNIIAQHWGVGKFLPTEAELSVSYNVPIGIIIKALDLLMVQGLVERLYGQGVIVRRPQHTSTLFRFFPFKHLCSEQIIPESFIVHRRVSEAPRDIRAILRLPEKALVINLARLCMVDGVPVFSENIWLPYYKFNPLAELPLDEFGLVLYSLYDYKCNQTVDYTEDSITAQLATAREAAKLKINVHDPILILERIAYDHNQKPIEWRVSKGVTDRVRYRANNH